MNLSAPVWFLIALAILTANLPFFVERPFLALPWAQKGETPLPAWRRWLESFVFFALLAGLCRATFDLIGGAFFAASAAGSVVLFLIELIGVFAAAALLLAYAGWRSKDRVVKKSFFERLLEVLVFYVLVGALGFALEANMGNSFSQTWEFYAITLCLFLVLAYPGFVYHYLLRHGRHRRRKHR
jgi:Protein of unknown function (DUF2818).